MRERAAHSLVLVVAHPDDDAFGCAGSVALHEADPGFRFILVHATDGGAGDIAPGFPATRGTLGSIRRAECENAWRAHGTIPDRHEWLGYPDGAVAGVPHHELVQRIATVLLEERPELVLTFGPDGMTGHPDHIAVGRATDEAFHEVREHGGSGLVRLLHGAMRASTFARWNGSRARRGLPPWDPGLVYHLRGVPDEAIGVEVDTSSVADRVLAGLMEHRSQHHVLLELWQSQEGLKRAVGRESYVTAWPPREPGSPVLADVFEGL